MITPCPRCSGQIVPNYDEEFCIQCGYVPRPDTATLDEMARERNKRLWSNSHSKMKGRKV